MISILISLFLHGQINPMLLLVIVVLELILILLRIVLTAVRLVKILASLSDRIASIPLDKLQAAIERTATVFRDFGKERKPTITQELSL
ncbi:MAG TPA: hypothetical protein VKR06_12815 [Ktedonosporobacter sp.]|nr:hypothetical protein [Ktedonosporobacter sp.]